MILHIVVWQLKADDEEQRAADAEAIRDALESLPESIPEIVSLRVRRNAVPVDGNWDLCLVGEYASADDLRVYIDHPEHQRAAAFVRARVSARSSIDLEV